MVTIVADTLSSIPAEEARELGIPYIPQIIIFGSEEFKDDYEMNFESFLQRFKTSAELPKTAAPPPALYTPIFKKFTEAGETVMVVAPSAEMSGTVRGATAGAEDFPNTDIRIIDSGTLGSALGSMVYKAHEWAKAGMDADELETNLKDLINRQRTYFVVDTLEYLHRGGRIGGAQMLLGGLLQVKPILQIKNGRIEPLENQRTKSRALARLKELVLAEYPRQEDGMLTIMHGDALVEAERLRDELAEAGLPRARIYNLPPAILVHVGPGVVAASFFVSNDQASKSAA